MHTSDSSLSSKMSEFRRTETPPDAEKENLHLGEKVNSLNVCLTCGNSITGKNKLAKNVNYSDIINEPYLTFHCHNFLKEGVECANIEVETIDESPHAMSILHSRTSVRVLKNVMIDLLNF